MIIRHHNHWIKYSECEVKFKIRIVKARRHLDSLLKFGVVRTSAASSPSLSRLPCSPTPAFHECRECCHLNYGMLGHIPSQPQSVRLTIRNRILNYVKLFMLSLRFSFKNSGFNILYQAGNLCIYVLPDEEFLAKT